MSNFTLCREGFESATSIPNSFIENHMPTAAGEFVKIYIYLLKCLNENQRELSISRLADVFNNTEKDTVRALKYWQKKGLLKLSFAEDGITLRSLTLSLGEEAEPAPETVITQRAEKTQEVPEETIPFPEQKQYSRNELETFSQNDDNRLLIYEIQKFLGRALTGKDINTIMFFEDGLQFSDELIAYVFEYCANSGHTNIRYIEKTAINWAQEGIRDVRKAKLLNSIYSENCYPVMKAFGLTGRNPAAEESRYITKWVVSYGFGLDMILEAVNRTINTIHQPSFEYADSILKNWKSGGISTLADVEKSDESHEKDAAAKRKADGQKKKSSAAASTAFNDFHQRSYDYDELEAKLINK